MFDIVRNITENVCLINYNNTLYILKSFDNFDSVRVNKDFIDLLKANSIRTIDYFEFDFLADNEICYSYLNKILSFDKHNSKENYNIIGKHLSAIHKDLNIAHGNLENSNIIFSDSEVYFLNPKPNSDIDKEIYSFINNNLPRSSHFHKSLNEQDFNQNEKLRLFNESYLKHTLVNIL